ncbi:hypothetical protein CN918_32190 [Priestia megaterium]|nr:hypothetical protein CN918_32190 [Priestia megaterium]
MRRTFKLSAEEWLFARQFAYMDDQNEPYIYETNLLKRRKANEPRDMDIIPYLVMDDYGVLINTTNQKGQWVRLDWESVKSVRLYPLMYPWKASIYTIFNEVDRQREKRKAKKYLRCMRRRYKRFSYKYFEDYPEYYSLIFETKKGNAQFYIPMEWLEINKLTWFLNAIEMSSEKRVTFANTDEYWKVHFNNNNNNNN